MNLSFTKQAIHNTMKTLLAKLITKTHMSTWNIDQAHSEIGFKIKHLMVSSVKGFFGQFSGALTTDDDNLTNAHITFEAQMSSVNTNNANRDGHLQGPDFFDTMKFPTMTFTSKSFTTKEGSDYTLIGDFMLKGVTKEIELAATFNGIATGTSDGKRIMSFDVTGVINRQDFGVTWNSPLETGGFALSNEVWLSANVEVKEV